jgi:precorrin-8X/cobalt-precorrin-8 methylmutase
MRSFDRYLFVDWSARSARAPERPRPDTIWIGLRSEHSEQTWYCRTRDEAHRMLFDLLLGAVSAGARILAGFDFPFAYPSGLAPQLGLAGTPWSAIWSELSGLVEDDLANRNDRFEVAASLNARLSHSEGPFWDCPRSGSHLGRKSPGFPFTTRSGHRLQRLRLCEERLPGTQETWKLLGVGSAGGQALTGIPRLHALRNHPLLAPVSRAWPFETGFGLAPAREPRVVYVEAWPRVAGPTDGILARVRDEAQVIALCRWAAERDRRGELAALLGPPAGLNPAQIACAVTEEGWILGAR